MLRIAVRGTTTASIREMRASPRNKRLLFATTRHQSRSGFERETKVFFLVRAQDAKVYRSGDAVSFSLPRRHVKLGERPASEVSAERILFGAADGKTGRVEKRHDRENGRADTRGRCKGSRLQACGACGNICVTFHNTWRPLFELGGSRQPWNGIPRVAHLSQRPPKQAVTFLPDKGHRGPPDKRRQRLQRRLACKIHMPSHFIVVLNCHKGSNGNRFHNLLKAAEDCQRSRFSRGAYRGLEQV
ncbi:hypothetical protein HPB51_013833 [Rhipicephalus microplus]|uniref:Uncharacterized protein n=1 Tax=Rhipicephalus microplus TaxID=6941 RepID=A0A9J6F4L1_RHIMP|nr:hypothetical protein HPB51_013833 [Rhipicephalus microplus]